MKETILNLSNIVLDEEMLEFGVQSPTEKQKRLIDNLYAHADTLSTEQLEQNAELITSIISATSDRLGGGGTSSARKR